MVGEKKIKILIVDDERINITALVQILAPTYTVLAAKTGKAAIEIAQNKSSKPDLILLDIIMPDMPGLEVLAELKKSDATRHIPVICMSGLNSKEDKEKALSFGAADYITKPYNDSDLKHRIGICLQS